MATQLAQQAANTGLKDNLQQVTGETGTADHLKQLLGNKTVEGQLTRFREATQERDRGDVSMKGDRYDGMRIYGLPEGYSVIAAGFVAETKMVKSKPRSPTAKRHMRETMVTTGTCVIAASDTDPNDIKVYLGDPKGRLSPVTVQGAASDKGHMLVVSDAGTFHINDGKVTLTHNDVVWSSDRNNVETVPGARAVNPIAPSCEPEVGKVGLNGDKVFGLINPEARILGVGKIEGQWFLVTSSGPREDPFVTCYMGSTPSDLRPVPLRQYSGDRVYGGGYVSLDLEKDPVGNRQTADLYVPYGYGRESDNARYMSWGKTEGSNNLTEGGKNLTADLFTSFYSKA